MRAARYLIASLFVAAIGASPWDVAAQADSTDEKRTREGLELRIAAARRGFEAWSTSAPADQPTAALVSFAAHLPPHRIRVLLALCACEPLALYRTVGLMQIGVPGDPRALFDADADATLGANLVTAIGFSLDPSIGAPGPEGIPEAKKARPSWSRADLEAVQRDAKQGRPRFTGVLLRGPAEGLLKLAREDDILAIEMSPSRGRSFPVTIDLLGGVHTPR